MLSLPRIILYLIEGLAITIAIYLISKKQLQVVEMAVLALTIAATFMVLDLFAPNVSGGARQGAGFGLGFNQLGQFGGQATPMPLHYYGGQPKEFVQNGGQATPMPRHYYGEQILETQTQSGGQMSRHCSGGQCQEEPALEGLEEPKVIEGMDDPVAIKYYQRYNPDQSQAFPIETTGIDQGAPRTLEKQIKENFEDTIIRSHKELEKDGAVYEENIGTEYPEAVSSSSKVLYSPLKPKYGYRNQLPDGWDKLEQKNLSKSTQLNQKYYN